MKPPVHALVVVPGGVQHTLLGLSFCPSSVISYLYHGLRVIVI